MNRLTLYIKEAYAELLHKVSWPSWDELQDSAVVVLVASLLIGLVVLGMDQLSHVVMKFIYKAIGG